MSSNLCGDSELVAVLVLHCKLLTFLINESSISRHFPGLISSG